MQEDNTLCFRELQQRYTEGSQKKMSFTLYMSPIGYRDFNEYSSKCNKFIFFYLNIEMATLAERIVLNDRSERKKCRRTTPCFHELQQQQWYTEGSQTPVVFIFVKKN